jgi:hypothetical protein
VVNRQPSLISVKGELTRHAMRGLQMVARGMFLVVICTGDRREYRMDRSFGLAFQALNRMEKRTLALWGWHVRSWHL